MYPALAVVQSLKRQCADAGEALDLLWVGSIGGMEQALVERAGLPIELIPAAAVRGRNPLRAAQNLWTTRTGIRRSRHIIEQFRPEALFVTGGYVCVPVTLAAHKSGVPSLIYLPDVEPGMAIKFLARYARKVAVTTPDSLGFFRPGQGVVTGYPVRAELGAGVVAGSAHRDAARQKLGLAPDVPVLLVFGGSRGARSINTAVAGQIEAYLAVAQVVHITGALDAAQIQARRARLPADLQARYHVFDYLHEEMPAALLAADLVVSRAGASVMGEFPAAGLPAVLVPYPHAGAHQTLNANYLARHGAAVLVNDADLESMLKETALQRLTNPETLQAMRRAAVALSKPEAADHLAREILEVRNRGTT